MIIMIKLTIMTRFQNENNTHVLKCVLGQYSRPTFSLKIVDKLTSQRFSFSHLQNKSFERKLHFLRSI